MSRALESAAWSQYRDDTKHLAAAGLHRQRIENIAGSGTPDLNEACWGREWWMEWKSVQRPQGPDTPIKIPWRPGQRTWLWKRTEAGCRAFLAIQVSAGRLRRRYLIPGQVAANMTKATEAELAAASLVGPTATSEEILRAAAGVPADVGEGVL